MGRFPQLRTLLDYPRVTPGDALVYDHRCIHGSAPNGGSEARVAVVLTLTPAALPPVLHFLAPKRTDRVLVLAVADQTYASYENQSLLACWTAGQLPEGATVLREYAYEMPTLPDLAFERLRGGQEAPALGKT
jgi:hypothetical protein